MSMKRTLERQKQREIQKKNKKILISEAEIERRIEEGYIKMMHKNLDFHYSINVPLWLKRCLWTMHNRYGWGKKRLNDFLRELIEEHKCINEKYLSDDDIDKELKKLGIVVKFEKK